MVNEYENEIKNGFYSYFFKVGKLDERVFWSCWFIILMYILSENYRLTDEDFM